LLERKTARHHAAALRRQQRPLQYRHPPSAPIVADVQHFAGASITTGTQI
jgi:hypothetical protein